MEPTIKRVYEDHKGLVRISIEAEIRSMLFRYRVIARDLRAGEAELYNSGIKAKGPLIFTVKDSISYYINTEPFESDLDAFSVYRMDLMSRVE